ncbi:MAG: stage II sporulation protein M [Acutalibacteraceae bacterium]
MFLLFCFLCGLSIWGAYCVPLAPLFRGFGMGITAGYLYAAYGFQGFLFHLAVILPGAFICLIAILIASRESMLFSKKIHLGRKTEEQEAQPKNNVRHFFIRFSILTGILIIGALVDVLTTVCFSGLFVF